MRYFRTQAFLKSFRSLPVDRQGRISDALKKLDLLFLKQEKPVGLGLKQLRHGIWEIRSGLSDRILFRRQSDTIEFLIAGNHDEIRRYLKNF